MYIPKHYRSEDTQEAINFMRKYNFATIISKLENRLVATHLPFVVSQSDEEIIIKSHFAKNNEQWDQIEGQEVMVIFTEPHAYISPKFYNKKQNVPTWNYLAIHAYGHVNLLTNNEESFAVVEEMIDNFEADYKSQWDGLPTEYKLGMINGIVSFSITVEDLQFKQKLSQNKKNDEQNRIADAFAKTKDEHQIAISDYMKKNIKDKNTY